MLNIRFQMPDLRPRKRVLRCENKAYLSTAALESWNGLDLRVARCVQAGSVERPAERLMRLCGCEEDVYGALKPC